MEQPKKAKPVSVAEASKLSKEKIEKLKQLSKKLKSTNQISVIDSPCAYHY